MPDWYEDHKFRMLDSPPFRRCADRLEHRAEKWMPVFGESDARTRDYGKAPDFGIGWLAGGDDPIMTAQPAPVRQRAPRRWAALIAGLYLAVTVHSPAQAQQRVSIVRDAEIEALVRD